MMQSNMCILWKSYVKCETKTCRHTAVVEGLFHLKFQYPKEMTAFTDPDCIFPTLFFQIGQLETWKYQARYLYLSLFTSADHISVMFTLFSEIPYIYLPSALRDEMSLELSHALMLVHFHQDEHCITCHIGVTNI